MSVARSSVEAGSSDGAPRRVVRWLLSITQPSSTVLPPEQVPRSDVGTEVSRKQPPLQSRLNFIGPRPGDCITNHRALRTSFPGQCFASYRFILSG